MLLVTEPESRVRHSCKTFRQQRLGAMVPFTPSVEEVIPGLQRHHLLTPMVFSFVNSHHDSAFSFDGTRARKSVSSTLSSASGRKIITLLTRKTDRGWSCCIHKGRGQLAFKRASVTANDCIYVCFRLAGALSAVGLP